MIYFQPSFTIESLLIEMSGALSELEELYKHEPSNVLLDCIRGETRPRKAKLLAYMFTYPRLCRELRQKKTNAFDMLHDRLRLLEGRPKLKRKRHEKVF